MDPIRILLVDDHDLVRQALAAQLVDEADFNVVGTLDRADDVMEAVRRSRPDVAVIDVAMPGESPFAVVSALRDEVPEVSVLFLSAFPTDHHLSQAAATQAGFVCKDDSLDALAAGIRAAAAGEAYYSPSITARLPRRSNPRSALTQREEEVLRHIARGLAKRDVAAHLDISVRTVETHVRNLMVKVGVNDRVGLARYAIREGYVEA